MTNLFNENLNPLYIRAIAKWSERNQLIMAIEEMSELTKEITKILRGNHNVEELSEEMADVIIMLEQLIHMFANIDKIKKYKKQKLERLEGMINE